VRDAQPRSGSEWKHSAQHTFALPAPAADADDAGNGTGAAGNDTAGAAGTAYSDYRGDCGELDSTVCRAEPRCAWSFFTGCGLRSPAALRRRSGRAYVERGYPDNPVAETVRDIISGETGRRVRQAGAGRRGHRQRLRKPHEDDSEGQVLP
jgi:hypothetical protein